MIVRILCFSFVIHLLSCQSNSSKKATASTEIIAKKSEIKETKETIQSKKTVPLSVPQLKDFVVVNAYDSRIQYDLKYATTDNFMHRILYDTLDKVYVREYVAKKLARAQVELNALKPGYRLLIYDGVRPLGVQQEMWDALDTIPPARRGLFVSNPKNGSVHNYGMAVDITILDEKGTPLDMGAGYDDMRKIAYPSEEDYFLKKGELKLFQVENRKLLRKVMKIAGFVNIPSEWWHFNAMSRAKVRLNYELIEKEFVLNN